MQFIPGAVVAVAIVATEFYKNIGFIKPEIIAKTVWVPSLVVGIVGAVLLGWGTKPWNLIAWDGITYGTLATGLVLIYKRVVK